MDIGWLEDFISLAQHLNFTRAADERNITQSAFSRRIKALEHWAGAPLIDRSTYPVRLLSTGEEMLETAKAVVSQLSSLQFELRSRARGGPVFQRFASTHSISVTHLAPLLTRLGAEVEGVRTQVWSDNLHACCQFLIDGLCDFMLCYRHPSVPMAIDPRRFSKIDLGAERLLPVCVPTASGAPKWRLTERPDAAIPGLAYSSGSYLDGVVAELLGDRRRSISITHMDAFAEGLKSLAIAGAGVAWLPEGSVREAIDQGRLTIAGGAAWRTDLTLSLFADRAALDETGARIWDFFEQERGARMR